MVAADYLEVVKDRLRTVIKNRRFDCFDLGEVLLYAELEGAVPMKVFCKLIRQYEDVDADVNHIIGESYRKIGSSALVSKLISEKVASEIGSRN